MMTRNRWIAAVLALVVVGGAVVVWRARSGDDPSAPVVVAGGSRCVGFDGEGSRIRDHELLGRALDAWVAEVQTRRDKVQKDLDSGNPSDVRDAGTMPPVVTREVCAVWAEKAGDEVEVTLLDREARWATYVEDAKGRGSIEADGVTDDSTDRPALPVRDGRWVLSSRARDVVLHVGTSSTVGSPTRQPDSPLVDTTTAVRGPDGSDVVVTLTLNRTAYALTPVAGTSSPDAFSVVRTASADVPTAGLVPFTTALAARGGVPQLAAAMRQAIVDPRVRRDDSRTAQGVRGRATRTLAVVAQTEVAGYGTVTVVEQRPTYSAVAADGALLVVPPPVGTDPGSSSDRPRVVALGISPGGFTRGGWTAGDWLPPRATGGLPEPLTYLAVGRATGAAGAGVRELEVRIGERRVIGKTSLVLVSGQQLSGIDPKARPYSLVVGTLDDGSVMQPLVPAEVQ